MSQKINFVAHFRGVYFKMSEDQRLTPYHLSIYNALFILWNECGWEDELSINRTEVMRLSKIGNANTYTKVLKQLNDYGYITYIPSYNPLIGSKVTIIRCDNGSDKGGGKGSDKCSDKGGDTLYKQVNLLNIETKKTLFERFWNLYNKKVDKKKTEQKWMKLDIETMEKIIAIVPDYVKVHHEERYRKHPATFLNNESWNDELKPKQTASDNWLKVIS
jgi:hypothetical protein